MGLYLLSNTTVGAGGVASVSFSNLDQTGSDLWIIGLTRSTSSDEKVNLYLNGDTTSGNYAAGWLDGRGTTETVGSGVFDNIVKQTNSSARSNDFGAWQISILGYANNLRKRVFSNWGGHFGNASTSQFAGMSTEIITANTNAITNFELRPTIGFAEGSQIYLYMTRG